MRSAICRALCCVYVTSALIAGATFCRSVTRPHNKPHDSQLMYEESAAPWAEQEPLVQGLMIKLHGLGIRAENRTSLVA